MKSPAGRTQTRDSEMMGSAVARALWRFMLVGIMETFAIMGKVVPLGAWGSIGPSGGGLFVG